MPRARHPGTSANRSHFLNRGRVAWWLAVPNLAGGRKWFDLMGSNHGTLTGGTTAAAWKPPGRPGAWGHVALDGAAGYVDCGSSTKLDMAGSLTMGAWIRCDAFTHDYRLVMAKGTAGRNYSFGIDAAAGNQGFYAPIAGVGGYTLDATLPVANAMSTGVWYRYIIAYDNAAQTLTIYQNGRQTNQFTGLTGSPTTNASPLIFGQGASGWGWFNGAMDDLFVASRAWTAADARADYDLSRRGYPGVLARPTSRTLMAAATAAGAAIRCPIDDALPLCFEG